MASNSTPSLVTTTTTVDPTVLASKVNFHYLQKCVILENLKTSSVIIWVNEDSDELKFRTFVGDPGQR